MIVVVTARSGRQRLEQLLLAFRLVLLVDLLVHFIKKKN